MEEILRKYPHISRIKSTKIYPLLKTFLKDQKITSVNCFGQIPSNGSTQLFENTIIYAWKEDNNISKHKYYLASKSLDELYSLVKFTETF